LERIVPKKAPLLSLPHVNDRHHLYDLLSVLHVRGAITRGQLEVISSAAASSLPGSVEVHQRTPKGVTYVRAGDSSFRVNVRAKLVRVYP
jgi:hypothetical protein